MNWQEIRTTRYADQERRTQTARQPFPPRTTETVGLSGFMSELSHNPPGTPRMYMCDNSHNDQGKCRTISRAATLPCFVSLCGLRCDLAFFQGACSTSSSRTGSQFYEVGLLQSLTVERRMLSLHPSPFVEVLHRGMTFFFPQRETTFREEKRLSM